MSDTLSPDALTDCLARLRAGDPAARGELIRSAVGRLERLSRKMLRGPFGRVGRWVDTGDVAQAAAARLWAALATAAPDSPLHFHRLAALHVRRELIGLARHLYGPHGHGANHASRAGDTPDRLAEWAEFHEQVQQLPADEAAVADLLYYQGLTQDEAATLLGVDVRTVQRRWQRARRALGALLADD